MPDVLWKHVPNTTVINYTGGQKKKMRKNKSSLMGSSVMHVLHLSHIALFFIKPFWLQHHHFHFWTFLGCQCKSTTHHQTCGLASLIKISLDHLVADGGGHFPPLWCIAGIQPVSNTYLWADGSWDVCNKCVSVLPWLVWGNRPEQQTVNWCCQKDDLSSFQHKMYKL